MAGCGRPAVDVADGSALHQPGQLRTEPADCDMGIVDGRLQAATAATRRTNAYRPPNIPQQTLGRDTGDY